MYAFAYCGFRAIARELGGEDEREQRDRAVERCGERGYARGEERPSRRAGWMLDERWRAHNDAGV
jgi:hypothetical protein